MSPKQAIFVDEGQSGHGDAEELTRVRVFAAIVPTIDNANCYLNEGSICQTSLCAPALVLTGDIGRLYPVTPLLPWKSTHALTLSSSSYGGIDLEANAKQWKQDAHKQRRVATSREIINRASTKSRTYGAYLRHEPREVVPPMNCIT